MKKEAMTLVGVGDVLIDREDPDSIFRYVADVLRSGDITYANCEQMYSDKGARVKKLSTYSHPRNIAALQNAGIDVISLANNHTLDHGPEALLDTMERLKTAGLPYIGVGKNLAGARQPVILESKGTTVGFLAYNSVGPEGYEAGENKPGYAPIRAWTFYQQWDPQPGTPARVISVPYTSDLLAMMDDIRKLRSQVDVLVVCPHWGQHFMPHVVPMYCLDIGHAAVEAGADIVLGTHSHMLKGIEIYKGKAIFYATGNFAIEMCDGTTMGVPAIEAIKAMSDFYRYVPDPDYPTYPCHPEAKPTMIVKALIEDGSIKQVRYVPCYVNTLAEPEIVTRADPRAQEVFDYVEAISRSQQFGTRFTWDGDEIIIHS